MKAIPFEIAIPDQVIAGIRERLRSAQWPDVPQGGSWDLGTNQAAMRELVEHWITSYDWAERERKMNRWPHFRARIEGYDVHFIHVRGAGEHPTPILLCHGWPGSFVEFLGTIDRLTRPQLHGGRVEDSFSVVIPSLIGYGFSSKPAQPVGLRTMARLFDVLMRDSLGYHDYVAQGGDFGAGVASWLGYEGIGCLAVHLNFTKTWHPADSLPETPEEHQSAADHMQYLFEEGAYSSIQGTKPLTLSYAMQDSPLGVAAWLLEKFHSWSDLREGDLWETYGKDALLDAIMVYLVSDTFGTAAWLYNGSRREPAPADARITKPVAIARYPSEIYVEPRTLIERKFNVVRWTEFPRGGHFAAFERPQSFSEDLWAYNNSHLHALRGAETPGQSTRIIQQRSCETWVV